MRRPLVFDSGLHHCFGCGSTNDQGLRLQFFETDDGVELTYVVPAQFEGPPGIVHGGIQATLLDEVLCMTAYAKRNTGVVTGELTVRYLRPAPTGTPLVVRGRIVEDLADSLVIAGSIHVEATPDEVARGRGRFFPKTFA